MLRASDAHLQNTTVFLSIYFLKNVCVSVCACKGGSMCLCGWGPEEDIRHPLSLSMDFLTQGLSPNLEIARHPSISKGSPVFSHYHQVGKEPWATLFAYGIWTQVLKHALSQISSHPSRFLRGWGNIRDSWALWRCRLLETSDTKARFMKLQN